MSKCFNCDNERVEGKYYCKHHLREKRIDNFKGIVGGTVTLLVAISIFISLIFIIFGATVDAVSDPNIPMEVLDHTCAQLYGDGHYYYSYDTGSQSLECVVKAGGKQ